MIEKFNFYDIYGYLLPGTLLFGLFWFPFGLATGKFPTQEISTTLLLLALAYILGHVLQSIASAVLPSMVRGVDGAPRAYSDLILDLGNSSLPSTTRKVLSEKVKQAFGLDLHADSNGTAEISRVRNTAFFQARSYLQEQKASTYVEQFEGLYAMMRGLAAAFFMGSAYLLGWCLSFHWQLAGLGPALFAFMVFAIGAGCILAFVSLYFSQAFPGNPATKKWKSRADNGLAVCLMLAAIGAGYFLGTWQPAPARVEFFLWTAFALIPIAGARCLAAYRSFALHFAETVWRSFADMYSKDKKVSAKDGPDS